MFFLLGFIGRVVKRLRLWGRFFIEFVVCYVVWRYVSGVFGYWDSFGFGWVCRVLLGLVFRSLLVVVGVLVVLGFSW